MLKIVRPFPITAMRAWMQRLHELKIAILFIAIFSAYSSVSAQKDPKTSCPPVQTMKAEQLFGLWDVRFTNPPVGLPATARLRLERHAEFSDSLAGTVRRNFGSVGGAVKPAGHAEQAALAGDLEAGMLLLDESSDHLSISGTWDGEMVKGSCGTAFKGVWKDLSSSAKDDAPDVPFMMRKLP
jgi:hypothetical protein